VHSAVLKDQERNQPLRAQWQVDLSARVADVEATQQCAADHLIDSLNHKQQTPRAAAIDGIAPIPRSDGHPPASGALTVSAPGMPPHPPNSLPASSDQGGNVFTVYALLTLSSQSH
jgi:hypothetical protein